MIKSLIFSVKGWFIELIIVSRSLPHICVCSRCNVKELFHLKQWFILDDVRSFMLLLMLNCLFCQVRGLRMLLKTIKARTTSWLLADEVISIKHDLLSYISIEVTNHILDWSRRSQSFSVSKTFIRKPDWAVRSL